MKEAKLLLVVDGRTHQISILAGQSLRIGSDLDCEICLDGDGIAQQHGTLIWNGGRRLSIAVHAGLAPLCVNGRDVQDEEIQLPADLQVEGQSIRLDIEIAEVKQVLPPLPPVPKSSLGTVKDGVSADGEALKGISSRGVLVALGGLAVILGGAFGWLQWKRHSQAEAASIAAQPPPTVEQAEPIQRPASPPRPPAPPVMIVEPPPPVVRPEQVAAPLLGRLNRAASSLDALFERSSAVDIALSVMTHTGAGIDAGKSAGDDRDAAFALALSAGLLAQPNSGANGGGDSLWASLESSRNEVAAVIKDSEKLENAAARQMIKERRNEIADDLARRFGGVLATAAFQARRDAESARHEALQIVEEAGAFQAKQAKAVEQMKAPLEKFRHSIRIAELLLAGDPAAQYETLLEMQKQMIHLTLDGHPEWEPIDRDLRPKVAAAERIWLGTAIASSETARSAIDRVAGTLQEQARFWTVMQAGLVDQFNGKITAAARSRADQALPDLRARMESLIDQAGKIESPDDRTEALVTLMIKIADGFQGQEPSKGTLPWWGLYPDQRALVGKAATALRNASLSDHDQAVCDVLAVTKLSNDAARLPSENTASLHLPVWLALDAAITRLRDAGERAAVSSYAKEHDLERALLNVISAVSSQQRSEQQALFGNDETTRRIFYEDQIGPTVPAAVIQAAAVMHSHNLVLDTLAGQASRVLRALSLPELTQDRLPNPHRIPAFPGEVVQEIRKLGDGLRRSSALVPSTSPTVVPKPPAPGSAQVLSPPPVAPSAAVASSAAADPVPPTAGFWKLDQLFEGTAYQAYSSNGKRFLLHLAQQSLKEAGVYSGGVDGIPGVGTYQGFVAYQKLKNLPVTGRFDAKLLEALDLQEMPDLRDWTPENDLRATSGRPSMQRPPATPPQGPRPPSPGEQLLRRAAEELIQRGIQQLQR